MESLQAFVDYCVALGMQEDDILNIDAGRPLGGNAELNITLGELKNLLFFAKQGKG